MTAEEREKWAEQRLRESAESLKMRQPPTPESPGFVEVGGRRSGVSDITIAILSCIEPPLPKCVDAVEAQLGGPYHVIHVKDVCPMHAAFNEMIWQSQPSKYVVQVDGDVVLKPWAVQRLYEAIQGHPWHYMAWGQLYEDGFGPGGSVRIWRRWPLRLFQFRDRRCVDRDLHARIIWTGMRRLRVDADGPFGTHYPRQTPFARWSKARADTAKWRYLGRTDLIREHHHTFPPGLSIDAYGRLAGLQMPAEEVARSKNAKRDWEAFRDDPFLSHLTKETS